MYLNEEIAGSIIAEIRQVINEDLNIMDETGMILASTDEKRINTFHEAAYILVNSHLERLIVEHDGDYNGCRRGVNLPIQFASETVGVIGITGMPQEVVKYGLILKKMTEMILYENFRVQELFESKREKNLLIHDLVHGNVTTNQYELEKRMKRNGINTDGEFSVAVLKNTEKIKNAGNDILYKVKRKQIEQEIVEELSNEKVHVVFNGECYIAVANMGSQNLYEKLRIAAAYLNRSPEISILCSIGNDYKEYTDIYRSYNEATNILDYFRKESKGIYLFNTVMLDFTINQLPAMHKKNLKKQIFKAYTPEEAKELCDFIIAYFNANGSLNELSEKYYSHKNTIQYKIKKVKKETGYDLRNLYDLFVLYMAAVCE